MKTPRKTAASASILLLLFFFTACTAKDAREIRDRTGAEVILKGPVRRIVSTAPSNTEIIADLGEAAKLIAIDRHSANVGGLPENLTEIDFFFPDAEALVQLEPDLIIANGHNATGSGDDPFRLLREMGIPVAYISMSKSIEDIYEDIVFIADILDVPERGEELIQSMKNNIAGITASTAKIEPKKTVYFEISAAPEMFTFGNGSYLNDMITIIGAINIFENDHWIVSPGAEIIIERNPDVILTNVNYIDDPIGEIKSRPGFEHINAVKNNRIYQIDTDSSVRPSARIIRALREMARAVYPESASIDNNSGGGGGK
jgi:iron complex transport system substrate-binding protein